MWSDCRFRHDQACCRPRGGLLGPSCRSNQDTSWERPRSECEMGNLFSRIPLRETAEFVRRDDLMSPLGVAVRAQGGCVGGTRLRERGSTVLEERNWHPPGSGQGKGGDARPRGRESAARLCAQCHPLPCNHSI